MQKIVTQDTKSIEIISALALIILSLFLAIGVTSIVKLLLIHNVWFWVLLFGILGVLQLTTIELYPRAEILRILMAWINGSMWIWLSLQAFSINASDIGAFLIGAGNLYAFGLNFLLIKKQWAI